MKNDETGLLKEYHAGADKKTFNRYIAFNMTMFAIANLLILIMFSYMFRGKDLETFISTLFMFFFVMILILGTIFGVLLNARKDQLSTIRENTNRNYCVFAKKGLKIHFKFTDDTEKILLQIPYGEIKFIDRCDENILKEIWNGKPAIHKRMRYLPMKGTGILYPNFTHPEDLLRIKMKQERDIKNVGPLLKPVRDSSDIIYINVDRAYQDEFMKELKSRMRT